MQYYHYRSVFAHRMGNPGPRALRFCKASYKIRYQKEALAPIRAPVLADTASDLEHNLLIKHCVTFFPPQQRSDSFFELEASQRAKLHISFHPREFDSPLLLLGSPFLLKCHSPGHCDKVSATA